jgi:hypothetical protein
MSEAPAEPAVEFLLDLWLQDIFFNPDLPEGITFNVGGPNAIEIKLKPRDPKRSSLALNGLDCKVKGRVEVTPDEYEFVVALLDRRFLSYPGTPIALPFERRLGHRDIDEDGTIKEGFSVPIDYFPKALQTRCDQIHNELFTKAIRFLKLLRWQQGADGSHRPVESDALYWRVSGDKAFYHVGRRLRGPVTTPMPAGIQWSEDDQKDFKALWNDEKAEEPLAHELLREAYSLAPSAPRSALLIAATALEVGIKSYISKVAPSTSWLLEELPAPPVHKMLRKYIPALNPSGFGAIAWDKLSGLFNSAQKLADLRNKVTHVGQDAPPDDELYRYMQDVSDLLYILDVLNGANWAKDHVSKETRALMGWTLSRSRPARGSVTMTIG